MRHLLSKIEKFIRYHALISWRTKAFWMRAILCWIVGAGLIIGDESLNFDARLQIRGPRPSQAGVVIVDVSEKDWNELNQDSRNLLRPLKEVFSFTDAFFWSTHPWSRLLSKILSSSPSAVGVTFFFGENIRLPTLPPGTREIFEDPRVIWGADVDSAGHVLIPAFATSYNANVGVRNLHADDDGNVRRFISSAISFQNLAVRVASVARPDQAAAFSRLYQKSTLINYTGSASSFQVVNFGDVLAGRVHDDVFKNRIVLIGSLGSSNDQLQTPLGRMSRVEVTANVVDNVLLKRSIRRAPNWFYLILLIGLMATSIWALTTYPQSVALVFFVIAGIIWAAGSVWAFDTIYFWVPVMAPLVQLATTYMVFLSFQLSLNQQRTWRLEQEQKFISETEQLKTNFVSMMSHDLKTPIAKIQAICDRLIATSPNSSFAPDLRSLRRSSDDLHRYIQSILQVTKVEAKDFKISREVTDINDDIERVVARLAALASERRIDLRTQLEPMFSIEADTTLIQEVIHNLIENAIKYTPPGGQVLVRSEEKDDNVIVVIEDTGPGIDPEEQAEIWGKFTRGRSTANETKGTGLGLYLVKYFVELHGGKVFLQSQLGQGTKIGFSIPAV